MVLHLNDMVRTGTLQSLSEAKRIISRSLLGKAVVRMEFKRFLAGLIVGGALIMAGLLLLKMSYEANFVVMAGLVAIAVTLVRYWRSGKEPERDERVRKIGAFGLAYSWLVTVIFGTLFFSGIHLGILSISFESAFAMTLIVAAISAILMQWHLQSEGDVA
jgi:hypothetical protein